MPRGEKRHVDREGFAKRREVRDILRPFLVDGSFAPHVFDAAMDELDKHRQLALRQVISFFREERIGDEMAALEILGRLATPEDDAFLARVACDDSAPGGARVACALVLLGHDAAHRIDSRDLSRLILQWQARFLAEEPSLRAPLVRLYRNASVDERATWISLQDREIEDREGRAAIFEMLLEVEDEPELRRLLFEALVRVHDPSVRAALRRLEGRDPHERDFITASLAALAARAEPDRVPDGWSASVGFCDGTGSFPLRFDFRDPPRRARCAVFVLNLETGTREALALTGLEVERYDRLLPEGPCAEPSEASQMHPVPVGVALGLLVAAERSDQREGRVPPLDFAKARRLLDPLADLRPRLPEAKSTAFDAPPRRTSATLLDHPGYGGWFYDAGDHLLDEVRLDVLRRSAPGKSPGDAFVDRAGERLGASGEKRRLARMLRHNALVHLAGGEREEASLAEHAARRLDEGEFAREPLVRRMVRESLHPGHYFLTPTPDLPERHDLASLILEDEQPRKESVFLVDLAWVLTRAMEVWVSRVPCHERPHSDHTSTAVHAAALAAAHAIRAWFDEAARDHVENLRGDDFGAFEKRLIDVILEAVASTGFPQPSWDPEWVKLGSLAVKACEALVFRFCLGHCPGGCLLAPEAPGLDLLAPGTFPAGRDAEIYLRGWPGQLLHQPTATEARRLAAFVAPAAAAHAREDAVSDAGASPEAFECPLCGECRPRTTRARGRLVRHDGDEPPQHVCRRCQRRYRRDAGYRAEVKASLGRLIYE